MNHVHIWRTGCCHEELGFKANLHRNLKGQRSAVSCSPRISEIQNFFLSLLSCRCAGDKQFRRLLQAVLQICHAFGDGFAVFGHSGLGDFGKLPPVVFEGFFHGSLEN